MPIEAMVHGLSINCATARELYSVTEQKVRVASRPTDGPRGTVRATVVQFRIAPAGSLHFWVEFGPRGPLKSGSPRWPQRPSKSAQAKGPVGSTGSGMTTAFKGVAMLGPLVLSHPNPLPCSPQLMNRSLEG